MIMMAGGCDADLGGNGGAYRGGRVQYGEASGFEGIMRGGWRWKRFGFMGTRILCGR